VPPMPCTSRQQQVIRLSVTLAIAYTVVLVTATHYPKPGDVLDLLPATPSDKALHFIAYGILATLVGSTLIVAERWTARSLATMVVCLAAFAAVDEATQPLFGRYADVLDWGYDCIGMAVGILLVAVIQQPLVNRLQRLYRRHPR